MPNPLMRLGAANRSRKGDVEKVTPVPDNIAGPVFPYRGQETHGVLPGDPFHGVPDHDAEEPVTYDDLDKDIPVVVPVRIVTDGKRERVITRLTKSVVGTDRTTIIGANPNRRKLELWSLGDIYFAVDSFGSAGDVDVLILPSGMKVDLEVAHQTIIVAAVANSATVYVTESVTVRLDD